MAISLLWREISAKLSGKNPPMRFKPYFLATGLGGRRAFPLLFTAALWAGASLSLATSYYVDTAAQFNAKTDKYSKSFAKRN